MYLKLYGTYKFINLIKKEDRVFDPNKFETLDDATRHRPNVGATMTPDIRLVTHPSKGNPGHKMDTVTISTNAFHVDNW